MRQPEAAPRRAALIAGPTLALPHDAPASLAACLRRRIDLRPDGFHRAVDAADLEREQTFERTWERAGRIAAGLLDHGIPAGRTVLLLQQDVLDFVPAFWACVRAGYVALPFAGGVAAAERTGDDIRNALRHLERPVLLADSRAAPIDALAAIRPEAPILYLDRLERAPARALDENAGTGIVCLVATSGSTGSTKFVALDANALMHRYFAGPYALPDARLSRLGTFPFDSITGLACAFANFDGWTQVSRRTLITRPEVILDLIGRFAITHVQATNSLANRLVTFEAACGRTFALGSLTAFDLGGEAVTRTIASRLAEMLARHGAPDVLAAGYGTTETGPLLVGDDPSRSAVDDAGGIQLGGCAPGVSLRIVDDDDDILDEGQAGHVEVRCPQKIFSGYCHGPQAVRELTPDGWWRTGDLGIVDNGAFAFHGRAKEVLVAAGRKLSLIDIDLHIEPPADAGCRALSFIVRAPADTSDRLGVALVFERDAFGLERVRDTIRQIAVRRYGLDPEFVTLALSDLPLTATGKVDRRRLSAARHADLPEAKPSGEHGPHRATAMAQVADIWRKVLGRDVGCDVDFFEAGGDSLGLVLLQLEWTRAFGRRMPDGTFGDRTTIATMANSHADTTAATPSVFRERYAANQRRLMSDWPGVPVTEDGLVRGRGPAVGDAPASGHAIRTFWVLQGGDELSRLFDHLSDMDVFGLRSGHLILDYASEDFHEAVALYTDALRRVQPSGPYFLGGICQGASIAVAIARTLQASNEEVRLLTIVEFDLLRAFRELPYTGTVAAVFGRWSRRNPRRHFGPFERGWRRMLPAGVRLELVDGDHFLLDVDFTPAVADAIVDAHETSRPIGTLPVAGTPPSAMGYEHMIEAATERAAVCGEVLTLEVTVANLSCATWDAHERSGIAIANHWLDAEGGIVTWIDGSTGLPRPLAPGDRLVTTLAVTVPRAPGLHVLEIDLVEQGVCWFKERSDNARCAIVRVEAMEPRPRGVSSLLSDWKDRWRKRAGSA